MKQILAILVMAMVLLATPKTISYQGVLVDENGSPKADGTYELTFAFYTEAFDGSSIWESSRSVALQGGLFSVILGNETPFTTDVDFSEQYWLGVSVESDAELTPRVALAAAGYAIRASVADSAVVASFATTAGSVSGLDAYTKVDGSVSFTGAISGVAPSEDSHLTTKGYVDEKSGSLSFLGTPNALISLNDHGTALDEVDMEFLDSDDPDSDEINLVTLKTQKSMKIIVNANDGESTDFIVQAHAPEEEGGDDNVAIMFYAQGDGVVTLPNTEIGDISDLRSITTKEYVDAAVSSVVSGLEDVMLSDGTISFTRPISGIYPQENTHLATKQYVDSKIGSLEARLNAIEAELGL
jgi:hypothetical protein